MNSIPSRHHRVPYHVHTAGCSLQCVCRFCPVALVRASLCAEESSCGLLVSMADDLALTDSRTARIRHACRLGGAIAETRSPALPS